MIDHRLIASLVLLDVKLSNLNAWRLLLLCIERWLFLVAEFVEEKKEADIDGNGVVDSKEWDEFDKKKEIEKSRANTPEWFLHVNTQVYHACFIHFSSLLQMLEYIWPHS